jgi:hypothetical protein
MKAARTPATPVSAPVAKAKPPVHRCGPPTLAQKLKAFDPARHGGEAMAGGRRGAEVF